MMVLAQKTSRSIPLTNVIHARNSQSRISIPVRRNDALYARLKHVSGVPSYSGGEGVPLSKLKALDILIGRLKNIKSAKIETPSTQGLTPEKIDAMIDEYSKKLHTAFTVADSTPYGANLSSSGLTLDIQI